MRRKLWLNLIMLCGLLLALAGPGIGSVTAEPSVQGESLTPWQRALENAIAERRAAGLPVPSSVTYAQVVTVESAGVRAATEAAPNHTIRIVATTIVNFDGPEQAGYETWPSLIVEDGLPPDANGTVLAGDYTEAYREAMEEMFPGIWEQYEFGYEPRRHTITETFEIAYPEENLLASTLASVADATSVEELILMGFTYTGPHLDYAIEDTLEVCLFGSCATIYDFKAGFELDWALGLRLPGQASLTGPDQMVLGSPYSLSAAFTPLDWSETQYSDVGVAAEAGNEFVLRMLFFVGVRVEVLGFDLCPGCYVEVDVDESTSFTTPFGAGAYFPIPSVDVPIKDWDFGIGSFGVGLQVTPYLGSDKVTANWQAGGDASGSGQITFSEPGIPVTLGPVSACNLGLANDAQVQLTDFQYWFNQFLIDLNGYVEFSLAPIEFLGINVFDGKTWQLPAPIAEFDLSPLTDGLYLGAHTQCDWDFTCTTVGPDNSLDLSIPVVDQEPPTTSIALSGTAGSSGWYFSEVQVTLSAVDNPLGCGAGVQRTEYSFDGASWYIYTGPFIIADQGVTTVYYRSVDNENNTETTKAQAFGITTDIDGLIAATEYACEQGWITRDGVCNALLAKLYAAKASIERGQIKAALNQLNAFVNQLDALQGTIINQQAYELLLENVEYVIGHLE